MAIGRILVSLSGGPGDGAALTLAMTFARQLGAHVDAVFAWPDPAEALPAFGEGLSGQVVEEILQAARDAANDQVQVARRNFCDAAQSLGLPIVATPQGPGQAAARFLEEQGRAADVVERASRLADLVVFPEVSSENVSVMMVAIEAALIRSRKPVLIAPRDLTPGAVGRSIAIGWGGRVEAERAVAAAMPFLEAAEAVTVITVQTGGPIISGQPMIDYLKLHGVQASVLSVDRKGRPPGQSLLDTAAEIGADLLVMGGFGHSRLREFLFGGVTRYILTHTRMPVLLAH